MNNEYMMLATCARGSQHMHPTLGSQPFMRQRTQDVVLSRGPQRLLRLLQLLRKHLQLLVHGRPVGLLLPLPDLAVLQQSCDALAGQLLL